MITALTNGVLIDGRGGPPRPGMTIVVDGKRIADVGQSLEFGPDVRVVDLVGKTVLPGLIDCHEHFGSWFQWLISQQRKSLMYLACQTVHVLESALREGCTTARDMGGLEVGFRDAVRDGLILGPTLQTALVIIQPTNGLTDSFADFASAVSAQGLYAGAPGIPSPWCDGVDACRAKVREVLRRGADVIKLANDGVPQPNRREDRALFTQDELDALVDEAHRAGVPVGVHAHYPQTVMMCLRAGVDSIEEACFLDEACVEAMVDAGTWYVPCMSNPRWWLARSDDEEERAAIQKEVDGSARSFALARQAGVRIALGVDMPAEPSTVVRELEWMVAAGMSAMEALVAGTASAAQLLGLDDSVGTLVAGRQADLLVVDGDPLADVGILRDPERLVLVMKGGAAVAGSLSALLPTSPGLRRHWFD